MPRDVKARRFLFPRQTLACRTRRNISGDGNLLNLLHCFLAKETALSAQHIALTTSCVLHRSIEGCKQLVALRTDAVKRAAFDEAFKRTFIDRTHINTRTEIDKRAKLPALRTYTLHAYNRILADVADSGKPEANCTILDAERRRT